MPNDGLTTGGLTTGDLDAPEIDAADRKAFGEDAANVRQIASELFERRIAELKIQGDADIRVHGRGLNWKIEHQQQAKVPPPGASAVAAAAETLPNLYLTRGDAGKVRVTWGTINGIQPFAMTAGDRVPLQFTITGDAYIYATATVNPLTLQWVSANVIISSGTRQATATVAYQLLGTVTGSGDNIGIVSWAGGDVTFDPCTDLDP